VACIVDDSRPKAAMRQVCSSRLSSAGSNSHDAFAGRDLHRVLAQRGGFAIDSANSQVAPTAARL
jgi:hypothetical protein